MKIGTPLSPSALKVMLLGSGELGKEVVISLQRLGVEVIAVDRYKNAPAHQVAHRSYVADMTNKQQLEKIISLEKPHFIVPEIEAINTGYLKEIEDKQPIVVVPSVKAVQLTMNREGIRCLAAEELGIATSPYGFANNIEELKSIVKTVGFPCFIKPTMSSSGKGQSKITSVVEIEKAWNYAAEAGRVNNGKVIVEGLIDFDYEITLLTVRAKNKQGRVETFFCEPIGHRQEHGDYVESWQPQAMSKKALEKSQQIAEKVTSALGGLGLFGVELCIKEDHVWFSEVSARQHDTGMVTMHTQRQSEFELHAKAILGLPVDTEMISSGASAVIYGQHDADGITFEGIDQALTQKGVDIRLFGKPTSFKKRRMGVALAIDKNIESARNKARQAARTVKPIKN